ncbi:hypothetical protein D3C72_1133720 [compost metagenome]
MQRLAAVLELHGVALEQGGQLGFGQLPELLAHRLPQGELIGGGLLEEVQTRQGRQRVRLLLQGGEFELQSFEALGARLLHVVLALVGEGGQGRQYVGGPLAIGLGAGRILICPLLAVTQQGPGLGAQLVLGVLQQPLAVAGELARRQVVALDACPHLFEQGTQRTGLRPVWLRQQRERLLAHCLGFGQAQGIAAAEVVAKRPLQGAAQLLLQAFLLALGLFGPIELLPAMKQGGGLNAGHQQQYEGGEGGIMGNFHI